MAIVEATNAVNGLATWMPTTSASSGMAIKASPNPSAERVNVDIKRMERTRMIIVVGSIDSPSPPH